MSEPLSAEVAAFIADHQLSLAEIEVLASMSGASQRWWDARQIYSELGIPVADARGLLDHLAGLNLFDIRITDEVRYRFQPGTRELADIVAQLIAANRTHRVAIVRAVERGGRRAVIDFADAFRLRKNGNR